MALRTHENTESLTHEFTPHIRQYSYVSMIVRNPTTNELNIVLYKKNIGHTGLKLGFIPVPFQSGGNGAADAVRTVLPYVKEFHSPLGIVQKDRNLTWQSAQRLIDTRKVFYGALVIPSFPIYQPPADVVILPKEVVGNVTSKYIANEISRRAMLSFFSYVEQGYEDFIPQEEIVLPKSRSELEGIVQQYLHANRWGIDLQEI